MVPATLETDRLRLRAWRPQDREPFADLTALPYRSHWAMISLLALQPEGGLVEDTGPTANAPLFADSVSQFERYEKRHFEFIDVEAVGELRIKWYGIGAHAVPVDRATCGAAQAYVRRHLPEAVAAEGDDHGLGFAIVHEGKNATWLLIHWWAHSDILCQLMGHTNEDGDFVGTDRPLHACVWEGVVISHEHRAWIETMMNGAPNPEAYLGTVLADGEY